MTAQEFQALLIEGGLSAEESARLIGNPTLTGKVAQLKQATEYQTIEQRANALLAEKQALEAELVGTDAAPGSRKYKTWYADNYARIKKLEENEAKQAQLEASVAAYEKAYGKITPGQEPPPIPAGMTQDEIKKIALDQVSEAYKENYAPSVVKTMTSIGTVLERHIRRGRKNEIDWKKLDEIAAKPEISGDVLKAYDEWDAPNVEEDRKASELKAKADQDAEITRRVNEELKKRNLNTNFPAGAEGASSGAPSPLSRDGLGASKDKVYDRAKLLESFNSVQ